MNDQGKEIRRFTWNGVCDGKASPVLGVDPPEKLEPSPDTNGAAFGCPWFFRQTRLIENLDGGCPDRGSRVQPPPC
jgi:hypothetical protein